MVLGGATTAPAPGNRRQRWAQTGVLVLTCKTWSYRRRQGCVVIVTSTEGRVCGRRPGCVVLVTRTDSPFGGSLFNIVHGGAGGGPLVCMCTNGLGGLSRKRECGLMFLYPQTCCSFLFLNAPCAQWPKQCQGSLLKIFATSKPERPNSSRRTGPLAGAQTTPPRRCPAGGLCPRGARGPGPQAS